MSTFEHDPNQTISFSRDCIKLLRCRKSELTFFWFMARCMHAGQLRARQARAEKYLWSFSLTSPNSGSSKILCNKYFQTSDSVHSFLRQIATKTPFYRNYAHNLNLKTTAWENHTGQIFANYFTWLSILEREFSTSRRGESALWADWLPRMPF